MKNMPNSFINIHTIEFKYSPDYKSQEFIAQHFRFSKKKSLNEKYKVYTYNPYINGLRYEYHEINKPEFKTKILVAIVNPQKVLGKDNLFVKDYEPFIKKYKFLIMQDFTLDTIITEIFTRIDYYIDIVLCLLLVT